MKKTLLFLFCGIAALCVSCKEGDDAATRFSFSLPEVVSVGSTTADVSSRAGFTLNDYPGLERGFAYGTALVLILIILLVNLLANALRKYFETKIKTN